MEEDQSQSQNEQKVEPSSAEKLLAEEKAKLEEQLKDVTDKYKRALADAENVRQRSQKLVEEAKLYGQWRLLWCLLSKTQEVQSLEK